MVSGLLDWVFYFLIVVAGKESLRLEGNYFGVREGSGRFGLGWIYFLLLIFFEVWGWLGIRVFR